MDIEAEFVHLARLALEGRRSDVAAIARRALRHVMVRRPDLAAAARDVLGLTLPTREAVVASQPLPVDAESRLELVRREYPVIVHGPVVWHPSIGAALDAVVHERQLLDALSAAGVEPTRSALLVGPPGVGKTLAARSLAARLSLPLLTLDLGSAPDSNSPAAWIDSNR